MVSNLGYYWVQRPMVVPFVSFFCSYLIPPTITLLKHHSARSHRLQQHQPAYMMKGSTRRGDGLVGFKKWSLHLLQFTPVTWPENMFYVMDFLMPQMKLISTLSSEKAPDGASKALCGPERKVSAALGV